MAFIDGLGYDSVENYLVIGVARCTTPIAEKVNVCTVTSKICGVPMSELTWIHDMKISEVTREYPELDTVIDVVEAINDAAESVIGYPIITLEYDGSYIDLLISEKLLWDSSDDKRKVMDKKSGRRERLDDYLINQIYNFAMELIRAVGKAEKT